MADKIALAFFCGMLFAGFFLIYGLNQGATLNSKVTETQTKYMKENLHTNVTMSNYLESLKETNTTAYLQFSAIMDSLQDPDISKQRSSVTLMILLGFVGTFGCGMCCASRFFVLE